MEIVHKLAMDLETKTPIKAIEMPRGDVNTRKLRFLLTANQQPWNVPEGAVAWICYRKSDGTRGEYDTLPDGSSAWTAAGNALTVTLAPQVQSAAGKVSLYICLRLDALVLHTFAVELHILAADDGPKPQRIDTSEDYYCITRVLPGPETAEVGQYLCVEAVNSAGRVTQVKAVDPVAVNNGTEIVAIHITEV